MRHLLQKNLFFFPPSSCSPGTLLRTTEMNHARLISGGGRLLHQLCTAITEADRPAKKRGLYQRLSELEKTGISASQTLNQYITEGNVVGKKELLLIVKELRKYRRFQHALEIMEWMERRNIKFTLDNNYAVHLDLVFKTKGVVAAENFFNNLPPRAVNKYSYGALLHCYCKELMPEKALALFDKMNELGYVTFLNFNSLMSLYIRLGQPLKVHQLVHDMKQKKIPMNAFTYQVWMNSCASLNDLDGVERIYEKMKAEDGKLIDWLTYSNLAAIYVKAKQIDKAELMLKKLEQEVKPREACLAATYVKAKPVEKAELMVKKLEQEVKQQREAYHSLMSLYAGTGNLKKVHSLWNSLKSVPPVTNSSYLIMISALKRLNDMEGLTKCFKEWESRPGRCDLRLVNVVISAYLSQDMSEEAVLVFKEAVKRSKGPFFKIREMFMMFFLDKRQLDGAVSHLEGALSEVKGDEWRPSAHAVMAFLKYYKEETDMDGVDELRKIFKTHKFDDSCLQSSIASSEPSPEICPILKEDSIVKGARKGSIQDFFIGWARIKL